MRLPLARMLTMAVLSGALSAASTPTVPSAFVDPGELRVRENLVERPGRELFDWGRERLAELGVAGLPATDQATRIARYIHDRYAFTPDRPPDLATFVADAAGNCYAHARLGAFLLRLAGIPTRFVYEVHLERKTPQASADARERGIGLFGQYHNDHFWLLYHDGARWVPFDSTLGIADYDEFVRVKIDSPQGGVANPPFLLWREPAVAGAPMENFTGTFWREIGRETLPRVTQADWQALLDTVGRLALADLMRPLRPDHEQAIGRVGRAFFGAGGTPR
ncbi:MAG TPA: transglutaminase-like domain-containing protein [Candidatus Polarisedimenticolaceae bacterium]|nr:transglutaminase-like domain-containing protein [Candidatus Polarisedimenticolaceae bacterium]